MPLAYATSHLSARETRRKAEEMLCRVGLQDRLDHQPSQLSGGQQQRVAIARSLANDPLLILADEPTANLDSHTGKEVLDLITRLNEHGKTIVLVTHDDKVAARAHRVLHMKDGLIEREVVNRPAPRANGEPALTT
jgi:ABC-type lipoprotein export system ATPase subunit